MTHAQAHVTSDRRIAAGDWVRMTGLAPSLRGVGKVVDADYDPKDGAMRAALVDMGAREYWIPVAELARVLPDEEARLVGVARERGLIDEELAPERARRLARALEAVTGGTASFVRSPGLLDLLWPFTSHADRDHGSRALAGLFDDALDVPVAARLEATMGAPPPPRPLGQAGLALEELAPWTPALAPDEVLPRLLGQLDRVALVARAEALGLDLGPVREQGAPELRAHVARHVTAAQLVDVLWVSQLRRVCRDGLDMRDAAEVEADALRARVKAFVAPVVNPFAPSTASVAPGELVPRLLAGLDRATLVWRAEAMGIDLFPVRAAGTEELRAFVAARTPLPRLLDALSLPQLRDACRRGLAMTDAGELTREELRGRLLHERSPVDRPGEAMGTFDASVLDAVAAEARAEAARALMDAAARVNAERQRQAAAARKAQERQLADAARARRTSQRLLPPARPDEVLPRILGTLNHQPLLAIASAHELTAPATRRESHQALISAILRAGLTLEAVLAHLTPNQLRLACGAIGLRGELEGNPDALRARLLAAASPNASPPG